MAEREREQSELAALSEAWAQAIVANDAARIGGFMTDDWVIVSQTGMTDRRQFLSFVESGDLTHEAMDMVSTPRVQTYGDTAVLTVRATNKGHYKGEAFEADEWTSDVFLKRDGRWLCVLSHITAAVET
ncbi:MAG: DUF4440 domain-containing protein [Dehalococcoidia bacterium]|nr:DUF4440 domain-containing protein [Dehalococcoidia bacterium]